MKKTIAYILILILLGAGVYYFVFKERDAFGTNEAGFKVEDTSTIGKIFLADKKGRTLLLEKKAGVWMVNDSFKAILPTVNNLLVTMMKQTAIYPVPKAAYDNVITVLAGNSIKVELYSPSGSKIKVFYVGGQAHDNAGCYMLMEGANTPYVVQIPGFEGYITPRYSTDIADWRDRTVYNVPASQLSLVNIQYPDEPLNSFIFKTDNEGKMMIDADPILVKGKELNKRRVELFSKFFEKVYCEGYINGTIKLDSVIKHVPKRCSIELVTKDGLKQHVDVYWMTINKRSKNILTPMPGADNSFDADRFYAVINNYKDTVIIQRVSFDKIFRKAWEFYTPDDTTTSLVTEPTQLQAKPAAKK